MFSIVALDIETTGLDSSKDAIIEIGVVKFKSHRVDAEWSSLVNPNRPVPPMITQLTGITSEMVSKAPPLSDVLQQLEDFVGDDPVLGHNIHFDLGFLQKHNILKLNDVIDTYELASVLLPSASRYNLSALSQALGVLPKGEWHRALNDAFLTQGIYLRLMEKANELPLELVTEFVRQSEPIDWDGAWIFNQILRTKAGQPVSLRRVQQQSHDPLFASLDVAPEPALKPNDHPVVLDPDETAALLEYGGSFSKFFNNYEQRPQQVEMLRAVTMALSEGQHLMVEAGTGTGKSFAYLIPAALWSIQNNQRVVISTNTINLQDQLIKKDIPDLRNALELSFRSAVLKGRANYLCPRRFEILRQRGPENSDQMRVMAKILVWLMEGGQGDRNEINLNGPSERDVWARISAEDEGCKAEVCMSRTGGSCPFYQARQAAQSAHLIIVNHALLLADIATGSRVLPDYDYLIVDEAHHIESAITGALSYRITQNDLNRLLRELGSTSSGLLGYLLSILKGILRPSDFAAFQQSISRSTDLAFRLDHDFRQFFTAINEFLANQREGRPIGPYSQQERILPATRTQPGWTEIEIAWDTTRETLSLLLNLVAEIHKSVSDLKDTLDQLQDTLGSLASVYRRLMEAEANLNGLVGEPKSDLIYWVEIQPNSNSLVLQIAPLHIGPLMEQHLWHEKSSVILTSATLTTEGSFDYLRSRLFADEADELALGSPFDYESSALLYLVDDIPEPADAANYQRSVEQSLIRLSKATGGKMLALFTSYTQLKKTSKTISPILSEAGIYVYEQGEGASANTLLETFRGADKAVLLGTRAFWEGVDIPGAALSVLVIVKLPFDVPSDPIIAARSETFEDPFSEYSLPEAILRFRQGFGRLIRTQSDRGVVVILDRRVLTKRYGKSFVESIPACTLKVGHMGDLPREAARWLNL